MTRLGLRLLLMSFLLVLANCKKEDNTFKEEVTQCPEFESAVEGEITDDGKTFIGNVYIQNQEQLEAFGCNGFTKVDGSILLWDVNDLSPLSSLQEITDKLNIGRYHPAYSDLHQYEGIEILGVPELKSLKGLENLNRVKAISILKSGLTDLNGFPGVTALDNLHITGNPVLESLAGLESLRTIGFLSIGPDLDHTEGTYYATASLKNLDGLSNVTSIEHLALIANNGLENIQGLAQINSLKTLTITNCNSLENLVGLEQLQSIEKLKIGNTNIYSWGREGNTKLTSLAELSGITGSVQELRIVENLNLQSLNGLSEISSTGILDLRKNASLQDFCALKNVELPENYALTNNAYNPTQEQLKTDACKQN